MKLLSVAEIALAPVSDEIETDLFGWHSQDPVFERLIKVTEPKTIIEVGSYKGASALHMAELTDGLKARIFCCDTWLSSPDLSPAAREDPHAFPCYYGVNLLYLQFLHNVRESKYADRIYPLQHTSMNAARLLAFCGILGDLIYIDGDHTYEGCYSDLEFYSGILAPNGILFGDDYGIYPSVNAAVDRFAYEHRLRVVTDKCAWVLQPLTT